MARKQPPSSLRQAPKADRSTGQSIRRWSIILVMAALLLALAAFWLQRAPAQSAPQLSPSEEQAAATGAADAPERLKVKVLSTRPHDAAAYTQGLLLHGGSLFESTG